MILALDPATLCGWATPIASGTWDLSVRPDESTGMRLIRFDAKLRELCNRDRITRITLIVFEAQRGSVPGREGATVVKGELQGVLKLFCINQNIEFRGYSPSEIKKHATGKGNCGKLEMLAAAKLKWPGRRFVDDNEVDAVWLLDLAMKEYPQ